MSVALLIVALSSTAHAGCPSTLPLPILTNCLSNQFSTMEDSLAAAQARIADLEAELAATDGTIGSLEAELAVLQADYLTSDALSGVTSDITLLQAEVDDLENEIVYDLGDYVSVSTSRNIVYVADANLHIRDGSGGTDGSTNGLGNLIIGYDEDDGADDKSGSHNIILGEDHSYSGYGGIVSGHNNTISGRDASAIGGQTNTVTGDNAVTIGGQTTLVDGWSAAALGGTGNIASGLTAAIVGGQDNEALSSQSVVVAGRENISDGGSALIAGGEDNFTDASRGTVIGGRENYAGGNYSLVVGGSGNSTSSTDEVYVP